MLPKFTLGLALILPQGLVQADTLLLDGVEMDTQTASSRPTRGSSMTTVESTFGAASERGAAVGEPPISRWEYPGFTVFFEHEHVIHSVVRH